MANDSNTEQQKGLQSVVTALAVLEALARDGLEHSVSNLSRDLAISKAGIYRVLVTLRDRGYVRQNPRNDRYALTLKCWRLGMAAKEKFDLVPIAQPYIEELSQQVREAINLAVYEHGEAIYLSQHRSPQPIGVQTIPGGGGPAHCVATGKVLLAYQAPSVVENLIGQGLTRYTELTHTTREDLLHEIDDIREKGYAINRGEWRAQVCGVAAPIRDQSGDVIAAIGACGPIQNFSPGNVQHIILRVVATARVISEQTGFDAASLDGRVVAR